VLEEFSAGAVATEVIEHLERRRPSIVDDDGRVRDAAREALVPVRSAYAESDLPPGYFEALEKEILDTVPDRWRRAARTFTRLEERGLGGWRGGDVVARLSYGFGGLAIGGFILWAPFIPVWEKWVPFALCVGALFLPDLTRWWQRRRYAKELGQIVATLERAQPILDRRVSVTELLGPPKE